MSSAIKLLAGRVGRAVTLLEIEDRHLERRDGFRPLDAGIVMQGFDDRGDKAGRADAVGTHMHRALDAVRPGHDGLHRLGIFGAEIEDVADLDAARGNLLVRRASVAKAAASCMSEVAA